MDNLFGRVLAIMLRPQTEWPVIARESTDTSVLFIRYVAILALVPALAGFIGSWLIGGYAPFLSGLGNAIFGYLLAFLTVFAVGLIIDALAPTFGADKNFPNALKLAIYSYTPVWLAGIFLLVPGLSFLSLLGLYGLYLLWLGLPPLMRAPRDKALPYACTVVLCALVITILVGFIKLALFSGAR